MTRFLGIIVFSGGFLMISPSLRDSAMGVLSALADFTSSYSPYSYILLVLVALGGITLTLRTGQTAR